MNKEDLILQKLSELSTQLGGVSERLGSLEGEFVGLSNRVEGLSEKVDRNHDTLVAMLAEYAEQQTMRFDGIDARLEKLEIRTDELALGHRKLWAYVGEVRTALVEQIQLVRPVLVAA